MNENRIGRNIAVLRKNANLTQSELAEALSISPQAISKWERGASLPDTQTMPAIAKFFHVSIDFLYFGKAEKTMHDSNTVNRSKERFENRMIYRYFKEEDVEKLTDEEFLILQQEKMKSTVHSRSGLTASFLEFFEGTNGEDISGNGDHTDFCIHKRIQYAVENNRTMWLYWYERIFTLAYRLGVRNFYDINCSEYLQSAMLVLDEELHYTGIDPDLFHCYIDEFHTTPDYMNEVFRKFTRSDRIQYRQDKYPCAPETAENNIGIAMQLFVSRRKPNRIWNAESCEEILAAMSRDFERIVFSISTNEPNPALSSMTVRDVLYGDAEVWINPFDELYAYAKEQLPEFELFRISSVGNREFIFATKNPLDRSILEKHYTVIGDRLLTGVLDDHWQMEMNV